MPFINLHIDPADIRELTEKLDKCKNRIPDGLKNAANAAARRAKKDLVEKAEEVYALKEPDFEKSIRLQRATKSKPWATLIIEGAAKQLVDFDYEANSGAEGAKGKLLNAGGMKDLTEKTRELKGFVVRFKSGHVAVVRREPNERYTNPDKLADRRKKKLDTSKLRVYYSPSVVHMLGNKKDVFGKVEPKIQENLHKKIEKQIEKILRGRR